MESLARREDGQVIAIDSSGIKLYNSGEWVREKHKERKPFLKLHVAVNTRTKQAVAVRITSDDVGDSKVALELVEEARKAGRVSKALMDGAYDTRKIWNSLNAKGVKPIIKLGKNATPKGLSPRAKAVRELKRTGEKEWAKTNGYGQRWQAETRYSSFKRRFGEHATPQNQKTSSEKSC